jgi:molybdopterin synthase sulfur carrier subunit
MKVTILAFGVAQDIIGSRIAELEVNGDGTTVGKLKTALADKYPKLAQVSFLIAINSEYAYDATHVNSGDEVAVIPPTSGG